MVGERGGVIAVAKRNDRRAGGGLGPAVDDEDGVAGGCPGGEPIGVESVVVVEAGGRVAVVGDVGHKRVTVLLLGRRLIDRCQRGRQPIVADDILVLGIKHLSAGDRRCVVGSDLLGGGDPDRAGVLEGNRLRGRGVDGDPKQCDRNPDHEYEQRDPEPASLESPVHSLSQRVTNLARVVCGPKGGYH